MKQTITLDNADLFVVINGVEGDALSYWTLLRTFIDLSIRDYFEDIGWVTFTCKLLNQPKFRHELLQIDRDENLENLSCGYKVATQKSESRGFNPFFKLDIYTAQIIEVNRKQYGQV